MRFGRSSAPMDPVRSWLSGAPNRPAPLRRRGGARLLTELSQPRDGVGCAAIAMYKARTAGPDPSARAVRLWLLPELSRPRQGGARRTGVNRALLTHVLTWNRCRATGSRCFDKRTSSAGARGSLRSLGTGQAVKTHRSGGALCRYRSGLISPLRS